MNTNKPKKETTSKEIAQNIFLHTSKMQLQNTEDLAHTLYTYTVDVKEISLVDITLDFTGGLNIKIENNNDSLIASAQIKPMSSATVCVIRAYDIQWSTPCKIKLQKRSPTIKDQEEFIKKDVDQLQKDIRQAQTQWGNFPLTICTQDQIYQQIRKNGTNFIDVDFLPIENSIVDPKKGQPFDRLVHWRRPREFMLPDPSKGLFEPQVFEKDIHPNDILQGQLGNCWFLCAVASLAEMPQLVERLFLTKEFSEEGVYRLRICKNGEWHEVVVDDHFPCFPSGGPIFSRGQGNELWVLLLEKAYSKLHGSYKNIVGGNPHEAMMDLTGCPTASFNFSNDNVQELVRSGRLWNMIKHYDLEGYLMSGGTPGVDNFTEAGAGADQKGGLIPGHAYSIIQAQEHNNVKLLNIRNPWGSFEWDGDWSDNSHLWTEQMKQAFNPILEEGDGSFWMSFDDFVQKFDSLDVCRTTAWDELRLRGRFIRYFDMNDPENEVVVSKWFYALEVPAKTHLVIGLHQEDERIAGVLPRRPYIDFGLAILKRESDGSKLHQFKDYAIGRDIELEIILEPGSYIVLPRTTGCGVRKPNESETVNEPLIDSEGNPNELFLSTINDLFRKFDLVISNTVDYKEFKGLYDIIGRPLTELQFKSDIIGKYTTNNGGLTQKGFVDWWINQAQNESAEVIYGWLAKLGYDKDFYSIRSRLFTITLHSRTIEGEGQMEVMVRDSIGTDLDNSTNKLILKEHGSDIEKGEGYRIVCLESPEVFAWTYGIINDSDHPIVASLDLSESENVNFSTKGASAKKKIEPQNGEFFLHAQAGFGNFTKAIKHEVQHMPRKK